MPDFFRSILKIFKQKKILFSVFLFAFLIGISLPNIASANWFTDFSTTLGNIVIGSGNAVVLTAQGIAFMANLVATGWEIFSEAMSGSTNWPATIVVLISNLISIIFFYIAYGSAVLFRFVLDQMINNPDLSITRRAEFLTAWNVVKSWANMLIVLGFIAASTMMILGFMVDKAKALLPKIIITAILINFSVVLVGLFIDSSNIIMRSLTVGGDQEANIVLIIDDVWNETIWELEPIAETNIYKAFAYFGINLLFDALYFFVAFILFCFALLLIQRYVLLAILFVLSPLAFALNVFPYEKAQKLFGDWWGQFLKYCFIGLGAAFFLNLSVNVLRAYNWVFTGDTVTALVNLTFQFIIVVGFLAIGMHLTYKSSGPIASAVMSVATKIASAIITGGTSTAMAGMKRTGITDGLKDVKNKVADSRLVSWGRDKIYGKGKSETVKKDREAKELDPVREQFKNIKDVKKLASIAENGTAAESAVATEMLARNGTLDAIKDKSQRDRIVKQAVSQGVSARDIASFDPDYATLNKGAMAEAQRKLIGTTAVGSVNLANNKTGRDLQYTEDDIVNPNSLLGTMMKKQAEQIVTRQAASTADRKFATEASDIDLRTMVDEGGWRGAAATDELTRRELLHTKETDPNKIDQLLKENDYYGLSTRRNYQKQDIRMNAFDKEAVKRIQSETDSDGIHIFGEDSAAKEEVVRRKAETLNAYDIERLDSSVLGGKYGAVIARQIANSPQQMRAVDDKAGPKLKKAVYASLVADVDDPEYIKNLAQIPSAMMEDAISGATKEVKEEIRKRFYTTKAIHRAGNSPEGFKDLEKYVQGVGTSSEEAENLRAFVTGANKLPEQNIEEAKPDDTKPYDPQMRPGEGSKIVGVKGNFGEIRMSPVDEAKIEKDETTEALGVVSKIGGDYLSEEEQKQLAGEVAGLRAKVRRKEILRKKRVDEGQLSPGERDESIKILDELKEYGIDEQTPFISHKEAYNHVEAKKMKQEGIKLTTNERDGLIEKIVDLKKSNKSTAKQYDASGVPPTFPSFGELKAVFEDSNSFNKDPKYYSGRFEEEKRKILREKLTAKRRAASKATDKDKAQDIAQWGGKYGFKTNPIEYLKRIKARIEGKEEFTDMEKAKIAERMIELNKRIKETGREYMSLEDAYEVIADEMKGEIMQEKLKEKG